MYLTHNTREVSAEMQIAWRSTESQLCVQSSETGQLIRRRQRLQEVPVEDPAIVIITSDGVLKAAARAEDAAGAYSVWRLGSVASKLVRLLPLTDLPTRFATTKCTTTA